MKKILLLTTGGTIASAPGKDGLEPSLKSGGLAHMIEGITSNYEVDFKDILNLDKHPAGRVAVYCRADQPDARRLRRHCCHPWNRYHGIYGVSPLFYAAQYPDSGGINRFPTANPAPADRWGRKSALCFCHGSQRCAGGIWLSIER